jgi:L-alanine-DL-glutamate epimerase-like enolase superfamily enzyme
VRLVKIVRVESTIVKLPFTQPGPPTGFGGRVFSTVDTLLVRVDTDAGLTGWGEAFGYAVNESTKAALDGVIAPACIGRDATQIAAIRAELQKRFHNFGRGGPILFGLSGLDIALWDLAGKAAGLPLHRLLGGAVRDEVTAYASLFRYGDAAVVGRLTAGAVKQGYRYVKLHEITEPPVRAAREAGGRDFALTVDTNCPWTPVEALEMARRFRPHDLLWLEEPVWPPEDWAGLARVRAEGGIALAAGENTSNPIDFKHMFDAGAVTYAQPSVTKIGGISALREVAALADAAGVTLVPHSPYFGSGLLATLHFLAAQPREPIIERLYCDLEPDLFNGLTNARDGRLAVPQGPGLGADPDPAVIARFRTA